MSDSTAANATGDEADYIIPRLRFAVSDQRTALGRGGGDLSERGTALGTSEIRCTGAVVTVNGRRYAPLCHLCDRGFSHLYNALTMRKVWWTFWDSGKSMFRSPPAPIDHSSTRGGGGTGTLNRRKRFAQEEGVG